MMKRMFGFFSAGADVVIFSCATAGAAVTTAAMPTARSAAKAVDALIRLSFVLLLRLTPEEIGLYSWVPPVMELPPPAKFQPAPCRNQATSSAAKSAREAYCKSRNSRIAGFPGIDRDEVVGHHTYCAQSGFPPGKPRCPTR